MLLDLTFQQLQERLLEQGFEAYRAKQIFDWIYKKACLDPNRMINLTPRLREWLAGQLEQLQPARSQLSSDQQTLKTLWKLRDGNQVESVVIEAPGRLTLCVSSQVGCAARCAFCASGKGGLLRNLSPGEILEQFLRTQSQLLQSGRSLTNLVFMGMGEPLHNTRAVVQVIRTLTSPQGPHFSARRITLSTVGIIEGIDHLCQEDLGIQLVLSLHAPTDEIRRQIIPMARHYPLDQLLAACDRFSEATGRDLTYEYTLLAGINDSPDHAAQLAQLLNHRQCSVNLIPYNPVPGLTLKRPSQSAIEAFRAVLQERGLHHTCRYTKGVDIAAACGQLALQSEGARKSSLSIQDAFGLGLVALEGQSSSQ